ncbi:MAG: 3-oxoacyl-ACP synthase III [Victivallales bacterium]|nr:3-oxoacyl-ACP synthase III [Victivallales bacterium]
MLFNNTYIESFGYVLPQRVVTSLQLEEELRPVYERLRLREGRLELMSGIRERRFWEAGTLPSQVAALAGQDTLRKADFPADKIQCAINCSVSRDCVEPATSSAVHRLMGLGHNAMNFDISNACLGMATGVLMLANMIELGQIEAGLAVAGENSGPLVRNTIERLNADMTLTRNAMKSQFASLTIGSCAVAVLVVSGKIAKTRHRLIGAANYTDSSADNLCRGDANGGMTDGSAPMMDTDSQALLHAGIAAASQMWRGLKEATGWDENTPDTICTHQVGKAHSSLLFETLGIDKAKDFTTFETLGNCGSASWPVTCAMAEESGRLKSGSKLGILCIGSGINCCGLAVEW